MPLTEKLIIRGGRRLEGDVHVCGGKNTSLAVICASLLCDEPVRIENLPDVEDVHVLFSLLRSLGASVVCDGRDAIIDPTGLTGAEPDPALYRKMRASYYLLGVLLAKRGGANVPYPGGCAIGARPIDQHIKGFRALGATIESDDDGIRASAQNGLFGAEIFLDMATVGGTINIMLAACRARGSTHIFNAAKEPHVVDTANFLNSMGARIRGAGTDVIRVRGVERLHACTYAVIPDQIETGTLMIAAAATHGDVTIHGCIPPHMEALSAKLLEMGARVDERDDTIRVRSHGGHRAVNFKTQAYPGFPTDLQQPMTALLTTASGVSRVQETIFDSRFGHLEELRRMGARAQVDEDTAVIAGVPEGLVGARVYAGDLRAGAALVVAGLMASGATEIGNMHYIDRGYEKLEEKLRALGADVQRVKVRE